MPSERTWALALRLSRGLGVDVVRTGYPSPVPDVGAIDPQWWATPRPMPGIALDLEAQLELVEGELAPHLGEFAAAVADGGIAGFDLDNRQYGRGDADVLYAMVRHAGPGRVVEVGCGNSTHVTAAALRRNAEEDAPGVLVAIDPDPRIPLADLLGTDVEHLAIGLEHADVQTFTSLRDGDILFIDSSHISKPASDVNRLFLEILPRLAVGVWVHVHDVFLPWDYPRRLIEAERKYWNEQYLLQALLSGNPGFEVKLALHALSRTAPQRLGAAIGSLNGEASPGAFWLRRSGGP